MSTAATLHAPLPPTNPRPGHDVPSMTPRSAARQAYLNVLTWAFTLFNSLRMASYLPTIWAVCASGDSSQHSLWTWGTWMGANLTMAGWLCEHHGQRLSRAAIVSLGNASMCTVMVVVIAVHRGWPF